MLEILSQVVFKGNVQKLYQMYLGILSEKCLLQSVINSSFGSIRYGF